MVAENTTKPYSDIAFATKITPVTTIAHMFKASKQILDDFAQLQSTVDAEMRYGLKYVEEQEILLVTVPAFICTVSFRRLRPSVQNSRLNSKTALMTCARQCCRRNWRASRRQGMFCTLSTGQKSNSLKTRLGVISCQSIRSDWPDIVGLPVVATEAAAFKGKFLTGAFNAGAQIFDREDANVVISTENADDFEKT